MRENEIGNITVHEYQFLKPLIRRLCSIKNVFIGNHVSFIMSDMSILPTHTGLVINGAEAEKYPSVYSTAI